MKRLSLLLLLLPSGALAQTVDFNIYASGFAFGSFTISLAESEAATSIEVRSEAKGLFGFFTRSKYYGISTTYKNGATGSPPAVRFSARSQRIFKDRRSNITFVAGRPTQVEILPLKDLTEFSKPRKILTQRIDPLQFIRRALTPEAGQCPSPQALYDGRRLTRVQFGAPVPSLTGRGGYTCKGAYEIEQGPGHSLQKSIRRFDLRLLYSGLGAARVLDEIIVVSGRNDIRLIRTKK